MNIRKHLDAFMAKLGYVPAPAKMAPVSIPLAIEVDISQVRECMALLEQMTVVAHANEAALKDLAFAAASTSRAILQLQTITPR